MLRTSVSKRKLLQLPDELTCWQDLLGHASIILDELASTTYVSYGLQLSSSVQTQDGLAENIVILLVLKHTIVLIICTTMLSRHWKRPHPPISLIISSDVTKPLIFTNSKGAFFKPTSWMRNKISFKT